MSGKPLLTDTQQDDYNKVLALSKKTRDELTTAIDESEAMLQKAIAFQTGVPVAYHASKKASALARAKVNYDPTDTSASQESGNPSSLGLTSAQKGGRRTHRQKGKKGKQSRKGQKA